jgi:hypothetical protein
VCMVSQSGLLCGPTFRLRPSAAQECTRHLCRTTDQPLRRAINTNLKNEVRPITFGINYLLKPFDTLAHCNPLSHCGCIVAGSKQCSVRHQYDYRANSCSNRCRYLYPVNANGQLNRCGTTSSAWKPIDESAAIIPNSNME